MVERPGSPHVSDVQPPDDRDALARLLARAEGAPGVNHEALQPGGLRPAAPALQRLLALTQRMNQIDSRSELFAYIRDRLSELFEAENSQFILVGRDGSLQRYDADADADAEGEEAAAFSETLVKRVVAERRPVLVDDTEKDPELRDRSSVTRLGLVSALAAPLVVGERVIGVMLFDHRRRPNSFAQRDLVLLHLFANQAATALRNVLLAEQRQEAMERMQEAQARLVSSETLRALGQMAAGVAHDFNNMLSSILGLSDLLLLSESLPATLRPDLETLKTCALDGAATVQRLQEFAGGSTGSQPPEVLQPDRLVREVAAMLSHRFVPREDGIEHRLALDIQPAESIRALATEVRDVLSNLVLNALDAMPRGGPVTLRTMMRGERVVLEVEDEGEGIPPSLRERIFEPFFTTRPHGHGLGLSICFGIVRRMGGAIDARTRDGGGTIFSIELDPWRGETDAPDVATPAEEAAPDKACVLLVDDDPMVLHVLGRILETGGHEVVSAASGADALDVLRGGQRVDVLVTDFGMPEMDGMRLAEEVRGAHPRLPIILVTGWNAGGPEGMGPGDVVDLVLHKPITAADLKEAVQTILQGSARR